MHAQCLVKTDLFIIRIELSLDYLHFGIILQLTGNVTDEGIPSNRRSETKLDKFKKPYVCFSHLDPSSLWENTV